MHGRVATEVPAFLRRLDRQADATRGLREAVYQRAGLAQAGCLLDVGSGNGTVTRELAHLAPRAAVVAVDADAAMAHRTQAALGPSGPARDAPARQALQADGRALPFAGGSFDAAVCNLMLLWTPEPARVVAEMARVVRPGGVVVASLEPDYGGKVHFPENPLIDLVFQGEGIRRRGGDPHAGRQLRSHFVKAGLDTQVGLATAEVPSTDQDLATFRRNRAYYRRMLLESGRALGDVAAWEREYEDALAHGIQTSYLPMFWAIGRKPAPHDVAKP